MCSSPRFDPPGVQTDTPTNWLELHGLLFDFPTTGIGRYRSNWCFRGQTKDFGTISSSLARLGHGTGSALMEEHLYRNFRKYSRQMAEIGDSNSEWEWLSLAQHHGLPTRAMDWTFSPYIALHFATDNIEHMDSDSEVWMIDLAGCRREMPSQLDAKVQSAFVLATEALDEFTREVREQHDPMARPELALPFGELSVLQVSDPYLVFFEPPSLDPRIINQYGLLSVLSSADAHMHDWILAHPHLCRRIIVPAKLKWEVRDKLDQSNITERVVYPGLGGLATWLKRHYSIGGLAVRGKTP